MKMVGGNGVDITMVGLLESICGGGGVPAMAVVRIVGEGWFHSSIKSTVDTQF